MLFYSHIWDFVLKVASLVAIMTIGVSLHAHERLVAAGLGDGFATFTVVSLLTIGWALLYRQFLSTIAAWLYGSVNLGARISLADARLARLFSSTSDDGVPMKDVRPGGRAAGGRAARRGGGRGGGGARGGGGEEGWGVGCLCVCVCVVSCHSCVCRVSSARRAGTAA